MKLRIIAVGTRMPKWVVEGFGEYAGRLPRHCALSLWEVPAGARSKTMSPAAAVTQEGKRMLSRIGPHDEVIALDVGGRTISTTTLASHFGQWLQDGRDRAFLIGGPDGLAPECVARAQWRWSLSSLTLPHGLARVVVAEALYRAWSVLQGHPYHRA